MDRLSPRALLGSSMLATGFLPRVDLPHPFAIRQVQDPIRRERATAELVRDATRMLGIVSAERAPASPLDLSIRSVALARRTTAVGVRQDPIRRERAAGPLRNGNPRGNPN